MIIEQETHAQFDADHGHEVLQAIDEYKVAVPYPHDTVRVLQIYNLVREANRLRFGDYAECGTHLGFTLKLIHRFMDQSCRLYSFDTFEGFDQRDCDIEYRVHGKYWNPGSFSPTSMDIVHQYLGTPSNVTFIKGWFPDTFTSFDNHPWRFVHLDMDMYAPTLAALDRFWPDVVPGGIVMVHDYMDSGFACGKAVDLFCAKNKVYPVVLADHWNSAVIRKGG